MKIFPQLKDVYLQYVQPAMLAMVLKTKLLRPPITCVLMSDWHPEGPIHDLTGPESWGSLQNNINL